jgi:hypothetical protein
MGTGGGRSVHSICTMSAPAACVAGVRRERLQFFGTEAEIQADDETRAVIRVDRRRVRRRESIGKEERADPTGRRAEIWTRRTRPD